MTVHYVHTTYLPTTISAIIVIAMRLKIVYSSLSVFYINFARIRYLKFCMHTNGEIHDTNFSVVVQSANFWILIELKKLNLYYEHLIEKVKINVGTKKTKARIYIGL